MSNLVERITGSNIEPGEKIGLHAFLAALNEFKRGKVTQTELISAFALTPAQTNQATTLVGLLNSSTEKTEFMRVFKDLMYLGEANIHLRYRDITFIINRLEDEITDNGGTLP